MAYTAIDIERIEDEKKQREEKSGLNHLKVAYAIDPALSLSTVCQMLNL